MPQWAERVGREAQEGSPCGGRARLHENYIKIWLKFEFVQSIRSGLACSFPARGIWGRPEPRRSALAVAGA